MNNFFTLNLSYGELLGMFPLEVSVISFDISHVGIHVARGNKRLGASDKFLLIVHTIEQDGNARLEGDEVETLFPIRIQRTGAFWGDAQHASLFLLQVVSQVVGHAAVSVPPYGNAA